MLEIQPIGAIPNESNLRDMETRPDHQEPPSDGGDPSPQPAAAYPRWVLLEQFRRCDDPDARTVAYARVSSGHLARVSLGFAPPPAPSRLRVDVDYPHGVKTDPLVFAAHGDSVLVQIQTADARAGRHTVDYLVYSAGDAPARPPSLSLLPPCYHAEQEDPWGRKKKEQRYMDPRSTALLRREEDKMVVVAALDRCFRGYGEEGEGAAMEAELCLLRSSGEWELKRLPVLHDEGKRLELSYWETDAAVPVGDRFLYWADYFRGVIYSDVSRETPELRYVSLPVEPDLSTSYSGRGGSLYRRVCATGGGGEVMFVEVFPRCCCGCPGSTSCARSRRAFTVTTWKLGTDGGRVTWDKVRVVDCDELWSLPGYAGAMPRVKPDYPVVSLQDPDVLCFVVQNRKYHMDDVDDGDHGVRLIEVDTRRMELRSISRYDHDCYVNHFISSAVSKYFNTFSHERTAVSPRQWRREEDTLGASEKPASSDLTPMASPEEASASTLHEMPDLARDDMLQRAYNILGGDEEWLKFRTLYLAVPVDLRKDYCVMMEKLCCRSNM